MKKKRILLIGILLLFSFTFVLAQPVSDNPDSLSIQFSQIDTIKQNTDHQFNFHVINATQVLTNETTTCDFDLYSPNGTELFESPLNYNNKNEFFVDVSGGNFSELGQHSYIVSCNTSLQAGFTAFSFHVTPNGKTFTTQNAISYLGFIIILLFTFFLTIYGSYQIRWKHEKSDSGKILTINNFRYLKVTLFALAYFELMFLFGLSFKFFNEANMEGFTEFFNLVYQIMLVLIYPLIIFLIIVIFVIWINNKKLHKRISLGLEK